MIAEILKASLRFNSKLVRLEVSGWAQGKSNVVSFQFQTGSIRSQTIRKIIKNPFLNLFQFQTGSIRRQLVNIRKRCAIRSFNSKLVRLKVRTAEDNVKLQK